MTIFNSKLAFGRTRLLLLQAQTLPDAIPQVGKIQTFSKIAVTFEPIQCTGLQLVLAMARNLSYWLQTLASQFPELI